MQRKRSSGCATCSTSTASTLYGFTFQLTQIEDYFAISWCFLLAVMFVYFGDTKFNFE